MQEIAIFKNEEFGFGVRVVDVGGTSWFVAKDIAEVLEYGDAEAMARRLDDDEKSNLQIVGLSTGRGTIVINESGLYHAIVGSSKPNAKSFRKWVTSDVLPSIRKHGAYLTPDVLAKSIANPDYMIGLLQALKETQCKLAVEQEQRALAENKNAVLMHVRKTYTATEVAKELGLRSATELNRKLAALKVQYQANGTWVPYADYADCGYFEIKQEILDNGKTIYHRRITQLGREMIINLLSSVEG